MAYEWSLTQSQWILWVLTEAERPKISFSFPEHRLNLESWQRFGLEVDKKKTTTHKYQVCRFKGSQVHQYNRHFHVLTMSVAFLDLVSEPKDRLHPHFCAKVPVKRTWRSALKSKTLTEMDFFNCQFSIVTQRDYTHTHTHVPVAYVQGHSSCSQIYPFLPLSTG